MAQDDDTPRQKAERLLTAVDQAAGHARNLFLFFLLLAAYVGIIIGSTTHKQLLKGSPVALPILDVELPLFWFYVLAPWTILLFHFNFLLQLHLLANKLRSLNQALGLLETEKQTELRERIYPFAFSVQTVGTHHFGIIRFLLGVSFFLTVVVLPLGLLVCAQFRFLPYHHPGVTRAQQIAVLVDLAQICLFVPLILSPNCPFGVKVHWDRLKGWLRKKWARSGAISMTAGESRARTLDEMQRPPRGRLASMGRRLMALLGAGYVWGFVGLVAMSCLVGWMAIAIPRLPPKAKPMPSWSQRASWVGDRIDNLPGALFPRHLQLYETVLVAGNPATQHLVALEEASSRPGALSEEASDKRAQALRHIRGLDLAGRDLRGANFEFAWLPKANLRWAWLQNADLGFARLHEADLGRAWLQEADLEWAQLRNANLQEARLQNANLHGAWLQNAVLKKARLQYANLQRAELKNVGLAGAQLQNANLSGTQIKDGFLSGAQLKNASLYQAQLKNADLHEAQLQNVRLDGALLVGANLRTIQSWQAIASLAGANLYGVRHPPKGFLEWAVRKQQAVVLPVRVWGSLRQKVYRDDKISWQAAGQKLWDKGITQYGLGLMYDLGDGIPLDYGKALAWYERAVKQGYEHAKHNLALLLATCEVAQYRDGSRSVELIKPFVEQTDRQDPNHLAILAAAYAEVGNFSQAVKVQQEAINRLKAASDPSEYWLDAFSKQLRAYRQQQRPWHEAPAEEAGSAELK